MDSQKLKERKGRARKIARVLRTLFPGAETILHYQRPWELLFAVILSAQTTDKKVNEVTDVLFKKYKSIKEYAAARQSQMEKDIYPVSFYKNKARNIIAAAEILHTQYNGKIPHSVDELVQLPGVGRKTANVVIGNLHGSSGGIAVDTHVRRFARKFDLTDHADPATIEQDLMKILPPSNWFLFGQGLVLYGQQICPARKHNCAEHPLTQLYPKAADIWPSSQ